MSLTAAQITEHLEQWRAADRAVALGQSYSVGDQQVTRVDAETIRNQITYWTRELRYAQDRAVGVKSPGYTVAKWT